MNPKVNYGLDLAIEKTPDVWTRLMALLMSDRVLHRVPLTIIPHAKMFILWDVRLFSLEHYRWEYHGPILSIVMDQRAAHREFMDTYRHYGLGFMD